MQARAISGHGSHEPQVRGQSCCRTAPFNPPSHFLLIRPHIIVLSSHPFPGKKEFWLMKNGVFIVKKGDASHQFR